MAVSGSTVLPIILGLNIAPGKFSRTDFGCVDNFDSFRIEVPTGLQITLTEFALVSPSSGRNVLHVFASDGVDFIDPVNGPGFPIGSLNGTLFSLVSADSFFDTETQVLDPGFYDVVPQRFGIGGWRVNFTETIPEPTSLAVFIVGAALAVRSRSPRF